MQMYKPSAALHSPSQSTSGLRTYPDPPLGTNLPLLRSISLQFVWKLRATEKNRQTERGVIGVSRGNRSCNSPEQVHDIQLTFS